MKKVVKILLLVLLLILISQTFCYADMIVDGDYYNNSSPIFFLEAIVLSLIPIGIWIIVLSIIEKFSSKKSTKIVLANCALGMEFIIIPIVGFFSEYFYPIWFTRFAVNWLETLFINILSIITYILYRKGSNKTKWFFIIDIILSILLISSLFICIIFYKGL